MADLKWVTRIKVTKSKMFFKKNKKKEINFFTASTCNIEEKYATDTKYCLEYVFDETKTFHHYSRPTQIIEASSKKSFKL